MHSPFLIETDFLSPLTCEKIVDRIKTDQPDVTSDGVPKASNHHYFELEQLIAERIRDLIPAIEERYGAKYHALVRPIFQHFPTNPSAPAQPHGCGNADYIRKKWVKKRDIDLVGYIWLKDFNGTAPIDLDTDVYGAKLEFPAYKFSLVPQRGTLILYPAGPHFITAISPVMLGDMYQIRIEIKLRPKEGEGLWLYQPANFPGTWQEWLAEHS